MIDSIRDRDVFVRLGRNGVRFRREPLWCTYLQLDAQRSGDPAIDRCHVAFAIGRQVGPAVVRNLLRRRLRMILRQHDFAPGYWLIGARPRAAELTFDQLESAMLELGRAVRMSLASASEPSERSVDQRTRRPASQRQPADQAAT